MRTTLDIDPRVLAIARSRVTAGNSKSLGEAVSALALAGLAAEELTSPHAAGGGLVLLPTQPGHVITDEMVAEALLDD
jgi:hypothetical protein